MADVHDSAPAELSLVEAEEAEGLLSGEAPQPRAARLPLPWKGLGLLAVVGVAVGTVQSASWGREHAAAVDAGLSPEMKWDHWDYKKASFEVQCGEADKDMDYVVETDWGFGMDHIPNPEMCCALCQGMEKCESWIWVEDAGLAGCPSQCWVKGAKPTSKVPKKGVIAGVPPPRKALPKHLVPVVSMPEMHKSGSIFCFSLIQPTGYETGLLEWQRKQKFSIFACDEWAVFSNKVFQVTDGVTTQLVDSDLKCKSGGDSGTALNAWIFIAVWKAVIDDGRYKRHDWVVKVDPDAVFFVDRLRHVLTKHVDAAFINNCKYGLHGPIEVVSGWAVEALAEDYKGSWDGKAPKRCVTEQNFGLYGEDMWLHVCLSKVLDLKPVALDEGLMCEDHCACPGWFWCNEGPNTVSYHPFKSIESYSNCIANAMTSPAHRSLSAWMLPP